MSSFIINLAKRCQLFDVSVCLGGNAGIETTLIPTTKNMQALTEYEREGGTEMLGNILGQN